MSFFGTALVARSAKSVVASRSTLTIEARANQKAIKHVMHARPKKSNPSDKNRKPTVYAPLPAAPAAYTVVSAPKAE